MSFNDSSLPPVLPEDAAPLVAAVAGSVLLPGDAGYDDERAVFNLNHELTPAVIVVPESVTVSKNGLSMPPPAPLAPVWLSVTNEFVSVKKPSLPAFANPPPLIVAVFCATVQPISVVAPRLSNPPPYPA